MKRAVVQTRVMASSRPGSVCHVLSVAFGKSWGVLTFRWGATVAPASLRRSEDRVRRGVRRSPALAWPCACHPAYEGQSELCSAPRAQLGPQGRAGGGGCWRFLPPCPGQAQRPGSHWPCGTSLFVQPASGRSCPAFWGKGSLPRSGRAWSRRGPGLPVSALPLPSSAMPPVPPGFLAAPLFLFPFEIPATVPGPQLLHKGPLDSRRGPEAGL